MTPDFSWQDIALERIWSRSGPGRRLVATSPTGSGKGNLIVRMVEDELNNGGFPIVYTNRRVLRKQISDRLEQFGVEHGVRAAGVRPRLDMAAQVSSIDTERHRSLKATHPWEVYKATLAIVDEAHDNKGETATTILDRHREQGAFVVGFTATPVGLGKLYDDLIVLIKNSELYERGVIVPCDVYAPSEINMDNIDLSADGEYVQSQMKERFEGVKWAVLGNVIESYIAHNPEQRPTILFPPGVPESRWFATHFTERGIPAEHIDADTTEADRALIMRRFESGETKVLTSFGVLSTGWDCPIAEFAILCRPVASVSLYLQMVGRILRAFPGKLKATLLDHVGAWHRPGLGSPDIDRDWKLSDTNRSITKEAKKPFEVPSDDDKAKPEPARCPRCSRTLTHKPADGWQCPCGHTFKRSVRMVIELNGKLSRKVGNVFKRQAKKDDTYFFRSAVFAAARSGRTVGQAYGMARKSKQKHTGDENASISRSACKIPIPLRDESEWSLKAADMYPWAAKRKRR